MANSLQEQLLKAGLVKEKQLKKANSEKRKQTRAQLHSKEGVIDEARDAALQAWPRRPSATAPWPANRTWPPSARPSPRRSARSSP